eukprot:PhF_6_TR40913/c0_g1_i2/m.61888
MGTMCVTRCNRTQGTFTCLPYFVGTITNVFVADRDKKDFGNATFITAVESASQGGNRFSIMNIPGVTITYPPRTAEEMTDVSIMLNLRVLVVFESFDTPYAVMIYMKEPGGKGGSRNIITSVTEMSCWDGVLRSQLYPLDNGNVKELLTPMQGGLWMTTFVILLAAVVGLFSVVVALNVKYQWR